ncbi:VOC family protein [Flavobacterium sp.]|jgi:methylmalonyl-CoA/ethylmalonyl-CoA epimerase|uniref:VOC family protein n=1 Tax=Flavobacterium sp. TaxID=239 RepID=UPI0037BE78FD
MKLHHYGFATKSIEKSLLAFRMLGYEEVSDKIHDPIQGVDLMFLKNSSDHLIELVAPVNENNPVSKILSKSGSSLYHICYEVIDLESTITELKSKKFLVVLPPTQAIAFSNRRISFLYHAQLGLIEILEK